MPFEEGQKPILELGSRAVPRAADRCHQLCARSSRIVLNCSIDGSQVELVCVLRLRYCSFQCLSFEYIAEVQEGARQRRDRDAVPDRHVLRPQPPRSMDLYPLLLAAPEDGTITSM
jgi:hypothetical protein